MIRLRADRSMARADADTPLVSGSVGVPVDVDLSWHYDGLQPTLVFDAGGERIDVPLARQGDGWARIGGEPVTVPHELLEHAGVTLSIGVYAANAAGDVVIRTEPAQVGTVRKGVRPSGIEPGSPTPSWAAQVQEAAAMAAELTDLSRRVTSLDKTELGVTGNVVEALGAPTYVADVAEWEAYGVTEPGWYVFARVEAPRGAGAPATVTGADGSVTGDGHADVAVRFEVASLARVVTVSWGASATDVLVFRATDLAVRNLDYRTTFYVYDLAPFTTWEFAENTDERFVRLKGYFLPEGGEYVRHAVVANEPAIFHTRQVSHPAATVGEAFAGTEYWQADGEAELGYSRAAVMAGAPVPEGEYFTHSYKLLTAAGKFADGVRYYTLVDGEYVLQEVTTGASYAKNVYYNDAWTAVTGSFAGTAYCQEVDGTWQQVAVVAGEAIPDEGYALHEVTWPKAAGTFQANETYYAYNEAASSYVHDGCAWVYEGGMYSVADVEAGAAIPAWCVHSKATFAGMARNVTYELEEIVDCPTEVALPDIPDDGYGAWYELQLRHQATYSMTLAPASADVKAATDTTPSQTVGINIVDLHYASIAGKRLWRLVNTHSTCADVAASIEVLTPPARTEYVAGEALDAAGLTCLVTFVDGSQMLIGAGVSYYTGGSPTCSPAAGTALTVEDTTLAVSFTSGGATVEASVPLTVTEAEEGPEEGSGEEGGE